MVENLGEEVFLIGFIAFLIETQVIYELLQLPTSAEKAFQVVGLCSKDDLRGRAFLHLFQERGTYFDDLLSIGHQDSLSEDLLLGDSDSEEKGRESFVFCF